MSNSITSHEIWTADSSRLRGIRAASVDLVVTSPPYPMIAQWDAEFSAGSPAVRAALAANDGPGAYEAMHRQLDAVWRQLGRVAKPGGIVCINIGDATRTIGENFRLFPNQTRVVSTFLRLGFSCLPSIIWRKETNAPNKFMGSGMLPAGAYVTLEHEAILLFRNGDRRRFEAPAERRRRRQSAIFWEERNQWFSDLWTFKGARQGKEGSRSGAFPFELAYRLVHMYSLREDLVLDPFLGTGTVSLAAAAGRRHSIGVERDPIRAAAAVAALLAGVPAANKRNQARLEAHRRFVASGKRELRHQNDHLDMPVMTGQETDLHIDVMARLDPSSAEPPAVADSRQPTLLEAHYERLV